MGMLSDSLGPIFFSRQVSCSFLFYFHSIILLYQERDNSVTLYGAGVQVQGVDWVFVTIYSSLTLRYSVSRGVD